MRYRFGEQHDSDYSSPSEADLHQPKRRFQYVKRRRHEILRGPHEALARLGLLVQLGFTGRTRPVPGSAGVLRLAPWPNFRLELNPAP